METVRYRFCLSTWMSVTSRELTDVPLRPRAERTPVCEGKLPSRVCERICGHDRPALVSAKELAELGQKGCRKGGLQLGARR